MLSVQLGHHEGVSFQGACAPVSAARGSSPQSASAPSAGAAPPPPPPPPVLPPGLLLLTLDLQKFQCEENVFEALVKLF